MKNEGPDRAAVLLPSRGFLRISRKFIDFLGRGN